MIEEIPDEYDDMINNAHSIPVISNKRRIDIETREQDIKKVLEYNILERKEDRKINDWKSYPGVGKIIDMARDMIENGNKTQIDKLATMMQCHESQQSAAVIATIAIIIGNKINTEAMNVDERYRRAIGGIIYGIHQLLQTKITNKIKIVIQA